MANQDDNFSLTRLPCGEDKEDLRQQIKDAKANLEVKQAVKMELDKALANPPGVTWNDVYDAVKTKVNASRPSGAPQAVYGGETRLEPDQTPSVSQLPTQFEGHQRHV